jgi:RNA polymerase sigma-70 factor (ECF subfamily)
MMAAHGASRPAQGFDAATLDACRRGDRAALERVLGAEAPSLERLLRRLIGPDSPIEDVLQDTLEAVVVAFPSFRGEASVSTWMARIATRTAYHHLRRPEARRRAPLELVEDTEAADATPPERLAATRRALRATYRHLAAMAPKKRIAFVLHVFEGRPIAEVAALMGATRAATKSRVFFARRELLARARRDPELCDLASATGARGEEP